MHSVCSIALGFVQCTISQQFKNTIINLKLSNPIHNMIFPEAFVLAVLPNYSPGKMDHFFLSLPRPSGRRFDRQNQMTTCTYCKRILVTACLFVKSVIPAKGLICGVFFKK